MLELPQLGRVPRTWTRHDKDDTRTVFQLEQAILVYQHRHWMSGGGPNSEVYATIHAIERNRRGGPHLAAGTPATVEGCTAFVRELADRAAFAGFMSPNILYVGPRVTAWWRAPAPARVWFETERAPEDVGGRAHLKIGKRSAITPHPGLVFILANETWHVYAVLGAARPCPDTRLYRSPYFNVWDGGDICEGNIERPKQVTPETIARFERAFFDSRFTHPNTARLVNFKGGAGPFWTALLDARWKTFPEKHLVKLKVSLVDQLRKLEGGRHGRD
jgi:PRTRC genetic system protein B